MLPPSTQRYLFRNVPSTYRFLFADPDGIQRTGQFRVLKYWARQDIEPRYPVCVLDLGPTGVLRTDEQPLSDVFERREVVNDVTALEELHGRRVYDELTVTLAEQGDHYHTDTSAEERMRVFGHEFYHWFAFQCPRIMASGGTQPAEIPVTIRQRDIGDMVETSGLVEAEHVSRRTFTLRLRYTLQDLVQVDRVRGIRAEFSDTDTGGRSRLLVEYDPATQETTSSTETLPPA